MRRIIVTVGIGLVGRKRTTEIEVEDDATEDDIEDAAGEAACEYVRCTWKDAE